MVVKRQRRVVEYNVVSVRVIVRIFVSFHSSAFVRESPESDTTEGLMKLSDKAEPSTEAASPFTLEPLVVTDAESGDLIPAGEPSRGGEDTADDDSTQLDDEFSPRWAAGPPSDRVSCSWTISMLDAKLDGGRCCNCRELRAFDLFCSSFVRYSTSISSSTCSARVGSIARTVYDTSSCVCRNLRFKQSLELLSSSILCLTSSSRSVMYVLVRYRPPTKPAVVESPFLWL